MSAPIIVGSHAAAGGGISLLSCWAPAPPLAFCSSRVRMRQGHSYDATAIQAFDRKQQSSMIQRVASTTVSTTTSLASRRQTGRRKNDNDNNDDDDDKIDSIVDWIETVVSIFSRPLGFWDPPLALGYPMVLLVSAWILPLPTFALFLVGFGMYSWLGRTLLPNEEMDDDEEEDRPPTDFLALGAAAVTSGLLTPLSATNTPSNNSILGGFSSSSSTGTLMVGAIFGLVSVAVFVLLGNDDRGKLSIDSAVNEKEEEEEPSNEKKLMDLWDKSFRRNDNELDS